MFWYKSTFKWVLRWLYLYSPFRVMHTLIVILRAVYSFVLCSAITRKAHEHSLLPERSQFIWTSEDNMRHVFAVLVHLSLFLNPSVTDPWSLLLLVLFPSSFKPFPFFLPVSGVYLLCHTCSCQGDSFTLMLKAAD